MKTDPQNSDYIVESGSTRNFEPWRDEDEASEKEKHKRNAEEMGDAMKSLENRTLDSKREMDILAALDEMKSMKSRHATVSIDSMLVALQQTAGEKEKKLEEEDEVLIKSIVFNNSNNYVRRISDNEFDDHNHFVQHLTNNDKTSDISAKKQKISEEYPHDLINTSTKAAILNSLTGEGNVATSSDAKFVSKSLPVRVSIIKKPESTSLVENKQRLEVQNNDTNTGLGSLCQNYGSDED